MPLCGVAISVLIVEVGQRCGRKRSDENGIVLVFFPGTLTQEFVSYGEIVTTFIEGVGCQDTAQSMSCDPDFCLGSIRKHTARKPFVSRIEQPDVLFRNQAIHLGYALLIAWFFAASRRQLEFTVSRSAIRRL